MYQLRFYFLGVETRLTPSLARAKETGPPEVSLESLLSISRVLIGIQPTPGKKMRKRTHGINNKKRKFPTPDINAG